MDNLLTAALDYHKKGFKVVFTGDNKRSVCTWAHFRKAQTEKQIRDMYAKAKKYIHGLAIICVDGVEIIDIDNKYSLDGLLISDYLTAICDAWGWDLMDQLNMNLTKNDGAHIIYRTSIIEGNQKLAQRHTTHEEEGTSRVLLETRADGGYFIVPPTPGYKQDIIGPDGFAPKISDEFRNLLINTAKSFDECDTHHSPKTVAHTPVEVTGGHKSTIDDFNEKVSGYDLLISAGWQHSHTRGDNDYLVRPGKKIRDGHSASYNNTRRLSFVFTSSTMEFEQFKAYNAFQVYARLNHGGDYSSAAKALYKDGYGDRMSKTKDSHKLKQNAVTDNEGENRESVVSNNTMQAIYATRFDINKVPDFINYCLTYRDPKKQKTYNIAAFGDLVTICGLQKSRKSALGSSMIASALSKRHSEVLRFTLDNKSRNIIYIDTEQSAPENYKLQKRVYQQAEVPKDKDGNYTNPSNYYAFRVRDNMKLDRLAFCSWITENKVPDTGVMYIDGLVDMCNNYNDLEESQGLVDFFMRMASIKKMLVIFVLHNARTTNDLRGHLGTELLNKSKAVIQVTKDPDGGYSTVNFKDLREEEPDDFDFTHDSNGNLVIY